MERLYLGEITGSRQDPEGRASPAQANFIGRGYFGKLSTSKRGETRIIFCCTRRRESYESTALSDWHASQ
jgi:hypothetical protein